MPCLTFTFTLTPNDCMRKNFLWWLFFTHCHPCVNEFSNSNWTDVYSLVKVGDLHLKPAALRDSFLLDKIGLVVYLWTLAAGFLIISALVITEFMFLLLWQTHTEQRKVNINDGNSDHVMSKMRFSWQIHTTRLPVLLFFSFSKFFYYNETSVT